MQRPGSGGGLQEADICGRCQNHTGPVLQRGHARRGGPWRRRTASFSSPAWRATPTSPTRAITSSERKISDVEVGTLTGDLLWADGVRRLATITEATDYAEGTRSSTVSRFEQHGGQVVAAERYSSDVTDFRSQLSKVLAASPDAVHLAPQSEFAAGAILKQARELGYDGPIYAETVSLGATALEIAGEAATGMKAIAADIHPENRKGQEVVAAFRERYGYVSLPWHLSSTYDDIYITAECLRQTGDDQDADGFRDCLYGPHLERGHWPELQLRRERRSGRAVARRGPSAAAGGTHSRQELRGAGPSRRGRPVGTRPAAPRSLSLRPPHTPTDNGGTGPRRWSHSNTRGHRGRSATPASTSPGGSSPRGTPCGRSRAVLDPTTPSPLR